MLILVTGATGKVGRRFIDAVRQDPEWQGAKIRALCHNRALPEDDRLAVVKGSIADRAVCERAMRDVTHVVHLATCKETPEDVMNVTVGGLFWLLEAFRASKAAMRRSATSSIAIRGPSPRPRHTWPIPAAMRSPRCWRR